MKLTEGTEIYNVDSPPVRARGSRFPLADADEEFWSRVTSVVRDDEGSSRLEELLASLSLSGFATENLQIVLGHKLSLEPWQVGEAIAEAWLADCRDCFFPWPVGRDLRNPDASPAGADLVGFTAGIDHKTVFAFGEVKTSNEQRWPPKVVTARHGLACQLEALRDDLAATGALVRYLGFRALGEPWEARYRDAATTYLEDPRQVALFGILVRDVTEKSHDLATRAPQLAGGCPAPTTIELRALYFPTGSIQSFPDRVRHSAGGA